MSFVWVDEGTLLKLLGGPVFRDSIHSDVHITCMFLYTACAVIMIESTMIESTMIC